MMLIFWLLITCTLAQKGKQMLTWQNEDRKTHIGYRVVLHCYGSQLPPPRDIAELLVHRMKYDYDEAEVVSHCLRARNTCADHKPGIDVYPFANFSKFNIIFNSIRLFDIGEYICKYYNNQRVLLGTECTFVDVSVPPDIPKLFVDGTFVPINRSSIAETAGKSVSLTCSTNSRPAVNISWDYPKWLFPKHYENQDIINSYLTETNSTVTFTMTSLLQGKIIQCMASSVKEYNLTLHKSVELKVLDPPSDLSVSLYRHKEESTRDQDTIEIKVKEDNTLICSMLSRTVNESLPHWNIPSSMVDVEESHSAFIYKYHDDFTVNTVRLNFEGTWALHNAMIECTAQADNNLYRVQLILEVEGYSQRQTFLVASVAIVTVILIVISCILIYYLKKHIPVPELHHEYFKKKESSMTASFRRSLPPVPSYSSQRTVKDQLSMAFDNSYLEIYEAIGEAEGGGRLDVIPHRDIGFTLELFTSRKFRRWLGSFVSGGNTREVLITCVDDNSDPKLQLRWHSYVALILRLPEHQNIISIFGISYHNDFVYVLQEYIETITLRYHLKTEYLNKILNQTTLISLLKYAGDIVDGMIFLAHQKCCHPGLSAQKILVNSTKTCKLYDFCAESDATDVLESFNFDEDLDVFPSLPPESLFLGEYTSASDVWSIGVTIWEILSCGDVPYPNVTLNEFEDMLRKRKRLERPAGVPCEIFEIIQSCWSQRSPRRLTVTVIKQKLEAVTSSILTKVTLEDDVTSAREYEDQCDVTPVNIENDAHNDQIYQKTVFM